MKIGKIDFNDNLRALSLTKFKQWWKKRNYEAKTGVEAEDAAKKLGIKVPKKKIEGGE